MRFETVLRFFLLFWIIYLVKRKDYITKVIYDEYFQNFC